MALSTFESGMLLQAQDTAEAPVLAGPLLPEEVPLNAAYQTFSAGDFDLNGKLVDFQPDMQRQGFYVASMRNISSFIELADEWSFISSSIRAEIGIALLNFAHSVCVESDLQDYAQNGHGY